MSTLETPPTPAETSEVIAPSAPDEVVRFDAKPKPMIYIGASAYEWKAECGFADSLLATIANSHCIIMKDWGAGDAAIGRKRNYQAWRFLTQTKADYLFFIDSDIIFEPWQFDRVVAHGLPICGGIYFKKSPTAEPVVEGCLGNEDPSTHLMKVKSAGTGFLCIRRDVFEAIIAKYGDSIAYKGDPDPELRWDFFPFGAVDGHYRSEDWYFCDRARACGFDVQVDCSVQLGHVGKIIFPLGRYMTDTATVDLLFHKYGFTKEAAKEMLLNAPIKAEFKS